MVSIVVLGLVFAGIAVRQVGHFRLRIWQVMGLGAALVLLTGQIGPVDAARAINPDVMLFLFGVFVVGQALEESGYLARLAYGAFRHARSTDGLVLAVLFGVGLASAFLMNDTLAIVGTPVVLDLARKHGVSPKLLLLALCFAVTLGSVMSPIGNPQNLLIATVGRMENPFVAFARYLAVPTAVNLGLAYLVLRLFFRGEFHRQALVHVREAVRDPGLARLCRVSLGIVLTLVAMKVVAFRDGGGGFRLTYIALAGAAPILLGSPKRFRILRGIDWQTLVFFAAMFVLMESVWDSGFFQTVLADCGVNVLSLPSVLGVSVALSQLISNVPLVALYLPVLMRAGASTSTLVALAAGSTVAGNLFILGAASNVIVIQNAEKRSGATLSFWAFAKVGVPLTVLNVAVYWAFFRLMG